MRRWPVWASRANPRAPMTPEPHDEAGPRPARPAGYLAGRWFSLKAAAAGLRYTFHPTQRPHRVGCAGVSRRAGLVAGDHTRGVGRYRTDQRGHSGAGSRQYSAGSPRRLDFAPISFSGEARQRRCRRGDALGRIWQFVGGAVFAWSPSLGAALLTRARQACRHGNSDKKGRRRKPPPLICMVFLHRNRPAQDIMADRS